MIRERISQKLILILMAQRIELSTAKRSWLLSQFLWFFLFCLFAFVFIFVFVFVFVRFNRLFLQQSEFNCYLFLFWLWVFALFCLFLFCLFVCLLFCFAFLFLHFFIMGHFSCNLSVSQYLFFGMNVYAWLAC